MLSLRSWRKIVVRSWPGAGISRSILISATLVLAANSGLAQTTARDFCNRGVERQKKGDLEGAVADYTRAIELNPQNVLAYNNRGLVKVVKNDMEGALADYDRALQISPRNFEVRTNRGVARQRSGDLDGALADYNIALKLYHKYHVAYSARANLRFTQNDLDGALRDCNLALDYNSKDASAYHTRGLIEKTKGDVDAANADFTRATKLDPKYARNVPAATKPAATPPSTIASQPTTSNAVNAPFAIPVEPRTPGTVEEKKTEIPQSRDVTQHSQPDVKASRPEPDFAPPIEVEPENIAAAYDREASKNKNGVPTPPATADQSPDIEPAPKRVDVAAERAVTTKALETAPHSEVARTAPLSPSTREAPSTLELRNPDAPVIANETPVPVPSTETKKLEPSDNLNTATPAPDVSTAVASRSGPEPANPAVSAEQNGVTQTEPDLALAMANRSPGAAQMPPIGTTGPDNLPSPLPKRTPPERDPTTSAGYGRRAEFKGRVGDMKGALADYTKAIQLDPRFAPAYIGRGNVRRAKHDYDAALTDYNRAIELDGGNSFAYYNRGLTKQNKGDVNGAIADFNPAIKLDPKNPALYHSRGAARAMKGEMDGALADYNKAIEIDPKDAATYSNRAGLYFAERVWNSALDDYTRCFELSKDNQDYPHLYVWLIRARTGQTEAANKELIDYVQQRGNTTDWFSQVAGYLLGGKTEDELLAATISPDKTKENGQLCEGWFYVGMKKLLSNDQVGAKDCFNKVIATGQKDFAEYHFARAELKALPQ